MKTGKKVLGSKKEDFEGFELVWKADEMKLLCTRESGISFSKFLFC